MSIFGYFAERDQQEPTYDPGVYVDCPYCKRPLNYPSDPIKTISIIEKGVKISYFYRAHKNCYESANNETILNIEMLPFNNDKKN